MNMRILIFTQKIDSSDPVLGFFHDWVERLSYHFTEVKVICLQVGENNLPKNVTLYEIGKQTGIRKINYVFMVYKYLYKINNTYDMVFIHMNQEYVFSLSFYWRLKKIPIYLWRNHKKGSWITSLAIYLSNKVFCTSKDSYTARFKKTVLMPAGIDTTLFKSAKENSTRKKYSVCMVGRVSPVKNIKLGLEVIRDLVVAGNQVNLGIIGPVLKKDEEYFDSLKKYVSDNNISSFVTFSPGVVYKDLPNLFSEYQICLNLTESGSFDKTIVEAASCGAVPLTTNSSMRGLLPDVCIAEDNIESISEGIKKLLDDQVRIELIDPLDRFVKSQSLERLLSKLLEEFGGV